MLKTILKFLLGSVLLIASQACASPAVPTPDPNVIDTAIAGTSAAALTQTAVPGIPITGPESPTPTTAATVTAFPTFTPVVLGPPQVRVSVSTNCRTGPSQVYDRVGALLIGETAEVVGRSADGNYWIIRNPDRAGACWLWGEHATLTGNPALLPVLTPPPPPTPTRTPTPQPTATRTPTPSLTPTSSPTSTSTPGFAASYRGMESCAGIGWWVEIELNNTGGVVFQSIAMTVRDTTTGTDFSLYSDDFTNRNGCTETDLRADLPAGSNLVVSSSTLADNPTGRPLRATITLCSNPGQSGACTTQVINFTP